MPLSVCAQTRTSHPSSAIWWHLSPNSSPPSSNYSAHFISNCKIKSSNERSSVRSRSFVIFWMYVSFIFGRLLSSVVNTEAQEYYIWRERRSLSQIAGNKKMRHPLGYRNRLTMDDVCQACLLFWSICRIKSSKERSSHFWSISTIFLMYSSFMTDAPFSRGNGCSQWNFSIPHPLCQAWHRDLVLIKFYPKKSKKSIHSFDFWWSTFEFQQNQKWFFCINFNERWK